MSRLGITGILTPLQKVNKQPAFASTALSVNQRLEKLESTPNTNELQIGKVDSLS